MSASNHAADGEGVVALEISAISRIEEIDRVNDGFEKFSAEHGVTEPVRRRVKLLVDDLLNNVISYAYDDDDEHVIDFRVELSADRLVVRIADDGRPFNPFERLAHDRGLGIEERKIGGLGIPLVEGLTDEVSYTRHVDQNVIVLIIYLSEEPRTEKNES